MSEQCQSTWIWGILVMWFNLGNTRAHLRISEELKLSHIGDFHEIWVQAPLFSMNTVKIGMNAKEWIHNLVADAHTLTHCPCTAQTLLRGSSAMCCALLVAGLQCCCQGLLSFFLGSQVCSQWLHNTFNLLRVLYCVAMHWFGC